MFLNLHHRRKINHQSLSQTQIAATEAAPFSLISKSVSTHVAKKWDVDTQASKSASALTRGYVQLQALASLDMLPVLFSSFSHYSSFFIGIAVFNPVTMQRAKDWAWESFASRPAHLVLHLRSPEIRDHTCHDLKRDAPHRLLQEKPRSAHNVAKC